MTAPTVDAAIHELMDLRWNVVYDLLEERDLLGDGFFVEEYTGIHSWLDGSVRYTVVHSRTLAVLFVDTRPVDAIVFHHELLGADDPASYFTLPGDLLHTSWVEVPASVRTGPVPDSVVDSLGQADPRTTRRYDRSRHRLAKSAGYDVARALA